MSHFYRIFSDELSSGVTTQSTLRDVYYTMKPKELFSECTSGQVSKMVSDVATILDCSRDSLKIRPSSHGMVFGRLAVQVSPIQVAMKF
jgi:DNA topoisomerase VI subunit A